MLYPHPERIIVRLVEVEEKTKSGLILTPKPKPYQTAEVCYIGFDCGFDHLSSGKLVHFHSNAGVEIEHEGEKYLSVHKTQVIAYCS